MRKPAAAGDNDSSNGGGRTTAGPPSEVGALGPNGFEPWVVSQAFGSQKLSAFTVALESWRRGLTVTFESPLGLQYTVSSGTRTISFNGSRSSLTTAEANRIVENKHKTLNRFRQAQVPVPHSRLFRASDTNVEDLLDVAEREYRWPVVIKPVYGSRGDGVFANIISVQELRDCYEYLTKVLGAERILLEEHAKGDDYRVYVVGDKVAGASRRTPANVIGDGQNAISELVKAKNALRKENPFLSKGLIRRDVEIDNMLARQGLDYQSVPESGAYVQLREKANASAGGDVEDVTDELPQQIADAAVAAVRAIDGLAAAGVDVLWDSEAEQVSGSFVIIEVNARAHIGVNMYPTHGRGPNVPSVIVDHFFPETAASRKRGNNTLTFNFDSALQPLKEGSVSRAQLAGLPDHGYPVRRVIDLTERVRLTGRQRQLLRRISRRHGISGCLERYAESTRLVVAGEGPAVDDFLNRVAKIINRDLSAAEEWHGVVMVGFYLSAGPLLRSEGRSAPSP